MPRSEIYSKDPAVQAYIESLGARISGVATAPKHPMRLLRLVASMGVSSDEELLLLNEERVSGPNLGRKTVGYLHAVQDYISGRAPTPGGREGALSDLRAAMTAHLIEGALVAPGDAERVATAMAKVVSEVCVVAKRKRPQAG